MKIDLHPVDIGVLYSKKKLVETGVVPTTVEMFLQMYVAYVGR